MHQIDFLFLLPASYNFTIVDGMGLDPIEYSVTVRLYHSV